MVFLIVWRHEYSLILVCMHRQRNIYQSRTLDLLQNYLSDGQDGGCKQRGQTATIWLKASLMPRLAVCSRDLHWHWINWTPLCDTMEVSMLHLAWLPIAQHVFQPALTGRLELISRKIVSRELNARSYRDFAKNFALLGATSAKFAKSVGKKMGSNMRPRYIQFPDIHDRDISGLYCNSQFQGLTYSKLLLAQLSKFCIFQIGCLSFSRNLLSTCPSGSFTCPWSSDIMQCNMPNPVLHTTW